MIRLRYHLKVKRRSGSDSPLLAEEVLTLAFTGPPNEPVWLNEGDAKRLLDVVPSGNLPAGTGQAATSTLHWQCGCNAAEAE